jgi:hypothetical protein
MAASPAFAQERTSTAQELLRSCGLWVQLGELEPQVRAGFAQALSQARPKPSDAEAARLAKVIRAAYEPARLRATATRVVANGLDEQHVGELRRWYSSPQGLAITGLEEKQASEGVDPRALATRGAAVLEQSTARRRELLADLVREGKVAESAVEMVLGTAVAIQRGVLAANPDAPAVTTGEINAALAPQRPVLLKAYTTLAMANAALTYQPLPDTELANYVAFMGSPAGQHFNDLVAKALGAALSEAAEDLGRGLPGIKDSANS